MYYEIIVKLHLTLSFRTKQTGGGGCWCPTSSSLRISDWPQVWRSCRAWDQKLSSWFRAPLQRGGLTNLRQRRNHKVRAALQPPGPCRFQKQRFSGSESSAENPSDALESHVRVCKASSEPSKEFNFTEVTPKKVKKKS